VPRTAESNGDTKQGRKWLLSEGAPRGATQSDHFDLEPFTEVSTVEIALETEFSLKIGQKLRLHPACETTPALYFTKELIALRGCDICGSRGQRHQQRVGEVISINRNIRARKASEVTDGGFTLIELLIVIVVLGILAAVVIFALGNITGKTAIASCQADGATVSTAMQAFKTENPGVTATQVLLTNGTDGGPYIQSWPANSPHYFYQITAGVLQVSVAPAGQVTGGGTYNNYGGPTACAGVQ